MEEKAVKPSENSSQVAENKVALSNMRRSDMSQQQEETYPIKEAQRR